MSLSYVDASGPPLYKGPNLRICMEALAEEQSSPNTVCLDRTSRSKIRYYSKLYRHRSLAKNFDLEVIDVSQLCPLGV
jgi:hypothetical protein